MAADTAKIAKIAVLAGLGGKPPSRQRRPITETIPSKIRDGPCRDFMPGDDLVGAAPLVVEAEPGELAVVSGRSRSRGSGNRHTRTGGEGAGLAQSEVRAHVAEIVIKIFALDGPTR